MQVEEQESTLLELQEKLGMMEEPALQARLQAARSSMQQHADRLRVLQAEVAARKQERQQHCQAVAALESRRQQALVHATLVCSMLGYADPPSACLDSAPEGKFGLNMSLLGGAEAITVWLSDGQVTCVANLETSELIPGCIKCRMGVQDDNADASGAECLREHTGGHPSCRAGNCL